jgi:predicted Zn-dependent peptidase
MLNRSIPPDFQTLQKVHLPQVQSQPLSNGYQLHWFSAGEQPVVRIELIFKAGNWYETGKGTSYFTVKMLNEGTSRRTARQINEYVDQFGAFIEFNHGQDRVNITLYTVIKHLPKLLPLLEEIVLDSVFPEKELQNLKNITAQNLKVNLEKTSYVAQTRFRELLFGEMHPYGRNLKEQDIESIQASQLKQYYQSTIRNQTCDILLCGNIDEATLALVRNTFEQIPVISHIQQEALREPVASLPYTKETIEKEDSLQSTIRLGKRMFTRQHPDYFKMLVLNEVFGGYFGSRLMKNIREEKGFTYGISSNLATLRHDGFLIIGTDVKKEFTGLTIDEVYKEMEILRNEPVGEEELQTVKNYMIGSFAGSLNSPFAIADNFKTIYFEGLTYDFFEHYIENILHTSARDLVNLANTYLLPDTMLEVVVGGR